MDTIIFNVSGHVFGGGQGQGRLQAQDQLGEAAVPQHTSGVGQRPPVAHRALFRSADRPRATRPPFRHATTGNGGPPRSREPIDIVALQKEQVPSNNPSPERNYTFISATWDPTEPSFETLNVETPKDSKQFMTVAVDLVIRGIQEPVRFQIETPVKIFGQSERNFWYFQRRSLVQQFFLNLKEVNNDSDF